MTYPPIELLLPADRPVPLRCGQLQVLSGVVWITERGRPDDVFLRAGERYRVPAGRAVLAEGVRGSSRVLWERT